MKKFLSILLASLMVLAMMAPAMAEDVQYFNITVPAGYSYDLYQIFTGKFANGKLSDAVWGVSGTGTKDAPVEQTVLEALDAVVNSTDREKMNVILNYVTEDVFKSLAAGSTTSVPAGYYLLKEQGEIPANQTASLHIVQIVDDISVTRKASNVTFEKKIKDENDTDTTETNDWQDSADYDIGDDVPFQLKGTVPSKYNDFTSFYFCFEDVLQDTLSFNNDVTVYVDGVKLENPTSADVDPYYTVNPSANGFKVEFTNLKNVPAVKAESVITAEYTAELLSTAKIGEEGNMNKARLEYSNNPNSTSHGTTEWDAVVAFTYKAIINKVDQNDAAVNGADFKLEKRIGESWVEVTNKAVKDNVFTFTGLDDGEYRLTETVTPAGYNSIKPMTFTVSATHKAAVDMTEIGQADDNGVLETLTATATQGTLANIDFVIDAKAGSATALVENRSGATLPETGGIGTTLFYLFGGLMTAGSALILVVRRRAEAEEE